VWRDKILIKICIISPAAYPLLQASEEIPSAGGAEAQFMTLGLTFAEQGYEVHYIVDDFGQADLERVGNVTVHKVALKYMGGPNYYVIQAWVKLWRTLLKIGADIHLIKVPRDLLLVLGLFCRIFKKKLIFVGQSDADVDPAFLKKSSNLFSYWFFRIGMKWTDYVVAQNEKQKKGFAEIYRKRTRIIKNITTLPAMDEIQKEEYILWVGNSLPKKQPEKFLELAKSLPKYKFRMIMSLTPQNQDDSFIRTSLSEIPNLDYLGFVPFHKIGDYYQKASLFVSTSLSEGFPNTFLQAWQNSTPVISLHIDPDGIVTKNKLGRVSGTFEKLKYDVKEFMEDGTARMYIGENAKRYVEENHSPSTIVEQYLDLFRELMK